MLSSFETIDLVLIFVSVMFIGVAKAGLPGVGMLTIPIFAGILGSRPSTGFLLPILLFADLIAVSYYKQHTQWKYLLKLSPWVLVGLGFAVWIGNIINGEQFRLLLGGIILLGVVLMLWKDVFKVKTDLIQKSWFSANMGFLGGFTSMIGNAAGPVMSLYLLSAKLPKNQFIGTRAWFFFVVNILKLPFHIYVWETITVESFKADLLLYPFVLVGMFVGFKLLKRIPENVFRIIVMCAIVGSAVSLFLKG